MKYVPGVVGTKLAENLGSWFPLISWPVVNWTICVYSTWLTPLSPVTVNLTYDQTVWLPSLTANAWIGSPPTMCCCSEILYFLNCGLTLHCKKLTWHPLQPVTTGETLMLAWADLDSPALSVTVSVTV